MLPTPGEDTFVNEELQDHSPSLLHGGRERDWVDIHLASHIVPYLWRPQYFVWPEWTEWSVQLLWNGDDDELEQTCSLSYSPP
jgi:hypothetical protein